MKYLNFWALVFITIFAAGCSYQQSLKDAIAPDSLSIGVNVNTSDDEKHKIGDITSMSIQLRWDLK